MLLAFNVLIENTIHFFRGAANRADTKLLLDLFQQQKDLDKKVVRLTEIVTENNVMLRELHAKNMQVPSSSYVAKSIPVPADNEAELEDLINRDGMVRVGIYYYIHSKY